MKLVIDISALDKTKAAVVSITNPTAVAQVQNLTFGDSEPLDITFTDSSQSPPAAPSWAGAAGYVPSVGFGTLDANALLNYTSTTAFVPQTNGWTGRLALTTNNLRSALIMGVQVGAGSIINVATDPRTRNQIPQWVYLWLQIQVIDPSGNAVTYALLRVRMMNREIPASAITTPADTAAVYAWILANAVLNAGSVTGLTGGTTTLDAYDDTAIPTGATILLSYGNAGQTWKVELSTQTTDVTATPARVRTKNYATLNRVWFQVG